MVLRALILYSVVAVAVEGHGYLLQPPARGTAWRQGFPTPRDSNDMGNYCGGKGPQHNNNQGMCGVCGEEYSNPNKRLEPGPANKFATGVIVGEYTQGQVVDVTVMLSAFHKGNFEFRLCENNVPQKGKDASVAVTNSCLNKNLLTSPNGETRFKAAAGKSTHKVKLPEHVTCTACVFQWRYRTGNNWGCENDKCGSGLGPQEEFVGCADVEVSPSDNSKQTFKLVKGEHAKPSLTKQAPAKSSLTKQAPAKPSPTKQAPAKPSPTKQAPVEPSPTKQDPTESVTKQNPSTTSQILKTLSTQIKKTNPVTTQKVTTDPPTMMTSTSTKAPETKKPEVLKVIPPQVKKPVHPPKGGKVCRGKSPYDTDAMATYCNQNCNHVTPYCPPTHCIC